MPTDADNRPVVTPSRIRVDARRSLIRAGEMRFAAEGIDGVSLRELSRAAGQRNTTSLQYHFKDRDGLLRAIVDKHNDGVSAHRHALLDLFERSAELTLEDLASAFVLPLAAKLRDQNGGCEFLQIAAQLANRVQRTIIPEEPAAGLAYDRARSIERLGMLMEPFLPPETIGPPLHRRFAAMRFAYIELGRRAKRDTPASDRLFTCHLIDLMTAILRAPLSQATRQALIDGVSAP